MLWIGFAVLTAAVIAALVRPLLRSDPAPQGDAAEAGLAVYRDQLTEIESDRERGLIEAAEADAARTELARRLIRRAGEDAAQPAVAPVRVAGRERLGYAVAMVIPVGAIAVYLIMGSPGLPSRPYAVRIAAPVEQADVDDLVAKVEARLRANPDEGPGWDVIAPVYRRQSKFMDAAQAYANAIRLLGETPKRLNGFAEAVVLANNGLIVEDARRAYQKILESDPQHTEARYALAAAKEQDGDLKGAVSDLRSMVSAAPPDASWKGFVEERALAIEARLTAPPLPGGEDIAAAKDMTAEQRDLFVNQMVERLAKRLAEDGKDLGGWMRLVRAYKVLGRDGAAAEALKEARRQLAGDEKAQADLNSLAQSLGLGS